MSGESICTGWVYVYAPDVTPMPFNAHKQRCRAHAFPDPTFQDVPLGAVGQIRQVRPDVGPCL
uniref:Uncharacterized protein n=1 Tax=viral metagenome TaxID=1070528 RepID=A0A6M3KPL0_9ZZZZ